MLAQSNVENVECGVTRKSVRT